MKCSGKPSKSMFWTSVLDVKIDNRNFYSAMSIAEKMAKEKDGEAMLLAWYDGIKETFSPAVECCSEEMPGWLVYAKSRGGNFIVNVNDGMFVFVFILPGSDF